MLERGIGRHGYDVYIGDAKAGIVTSGTQTPTLKKAIGMAYLPVEHTAPGRNSTSTFAAAAPARASWRCPFIRERNDGLSRQP